MIALSLSDLNEFQSFVTRIIWNWICSDLPYFPPADALISRRGNNTLTHTSHTHTHTLFHTQHTHCLSLSLSQTYKHSHIRAHTLTCTHTDPHTHTHTLSQTYTLSHSHTRTLTHMLAHTQRQEPLQFTKNRSNLDNCVCLNKISSSSAFSNEGKWREFFWSEKILKVMPCPSWP